MSDEIKEIPLSEAKENIEYDCFFIDLIYEYLTTIEENKRIKFMSFMLASLFIGIMFLINNLLSINKIYYLVALGVWISGLIWHKIGYILSLTNLNNKFSALKYNVAFGHFTHVEGYKDMEEWLRNKVFEEDIAPIAGIYKRDEENNDGE